MAASNDSRHLSLIDAGISNIWSLSLPTFLESLNLHANHIEHMSNLSHLTRLVHLDLSANQISHIDGLDKLQSLRTLNLSCNLLAAVDGVSQLRSLERLDVSYNQVSDLGGLAELGSRPCRLQHIALQGNKVRSLGHMLDSLRNVRSLRHLALQQDGSSNPVCSIQGYERELFSNLNQLESINDLDRSGKLSSAMDSMSHIPGLEAYLDFLLSSDKEPEVPEKDALSPRSVITPKIDAVMEQFRHKFLNTEDTSYSTGQSVSSPTSEGDQQTERMRQILCDNESSNTTRAKGRSKNRVGWASSGEDSEPVRDKDKGDKQSSQKQKKILKHGPKQATRTSSGKCSSASGDTHKTTMSKHTDRGRPRAGGGDSGDRQGQKGQPARGDGDDRQRRDDAEAVYKDILGTLESERERRWKAEQATRRLANALKEIQAKGEANEAMKTSALEATVQLKQALLSEHEVNLALKEQLKKMHAEMKGVQESVEESKRAEERSREALKAAEATLASREAEGMADRVHQTKRLQEAQQRASALGREVDMLRHAGETSKTKTHQLHETLAEREQQHREEMKKCYHVDSAEFQKLISKKVGSVEKSHQAELVKQQDRVEQLSRQYTELEDEFRYALQTEETRFQQLKGDLELASTDLSEHRQLLVAAHRKDESSTVMVAELTALVKEQKGRISELSKSKQEQIITYKERIRDLEESLEGARKDGSSMESLRQAKSKLQATVQAQESVIEGLKAERKLWGLELAQQGASLSQDRGRLEAKIEAHNTEIASLKKQLEREADSVRIKAKLIDDQTETIRRLKEAVVERDETIRATREENVSGQRSLEEQLTEHKTALDDTRELLDRSQARKEELKRQVSQLQQELDDTKHTHSTLSARWKEKSELIGRLEQQVTQMKNTWTQKEARLGAERDAALDQAKQAVDKLKAADSAFRQQLDVKEAAFQEELTRVQLEKQQELELANQKVTMVEEEMRELLRENEANKRGMETKVKKLTQALGDLQTNLL